MLPIPFAPNLGTPTFFLAHFISMVLHPRFHYRSLSLFIKHFSVKKANDKRPIFRFWNISTGDEIRRVKDFYLYEGVPSQLLCCQVSNNGKKIAVTTADGALYMGEIDDVMVAEGCASARLKE